MFKKHFEKIKKFLLPVSIASLSGACIACYGMPAEGYYRDQAQAFDEDAYSGIVRECPTGDGRYAHGGDVTCTDNKDKQYKDGAECNADNFREVCTDGDEKFVCDNGTMKRVPCGHCSVVKDGEVSCETDQYSYRDNDVCWKENVKCVE